MKGRGGVGYYAGVGDHDVEGCDVVVILEEGYGDGAVRFRPWSSRF